MDEVLLYPGVRHVGQTTGADSRYTDVDAYAIRDGLEVSIPRKVWFGRARRQCAVRARKGVRR